MIRIFGIALISSVLYIVVKKYSPEYSVLLESASVLIILLLVYPALCGIIDFFYEYTQADNAHADYIKIVIKALGTAILSQFSADLCRDAGESALASKIEFAGKLLITSMSLPIARALLELAARVINQQ